MPRWLCLILLCLPAFVQAQGGLPRWDALPAIDVQHLQGAYAGRRVCPVCRHGYDAGLLVLLPSATSAAEAAPIAQALRRAAAAAGSERFRAFLILSGEPPAPALLAAVAGAEANWYVAHLPAAQWRAAARDFDLPQESSGEGYVFAQRRVLWRFDPRSAPGSPALDARARYALEFLEATYAQAADGDDPDTPRGRLWTAPPRLSSHVALAPAATTRASRLCFVDAGVARADALLALGLPDSASPQRVHWARSDDAGCVWLGGAPQPTRLRVELFSPLRAAAAIDVDTRELSPERALEVALGDAAPTGVSGRERIVGQPCEGCEAVFDGLPARLASSVRLAPPDEPGEALHLSGIVRDAGGRARPGIVVYAYHTDRGGRYPADPALHGEAARHGRLRGWARTDADGRYEVRTIRPGGYPGESMPQHVHLHVIEPGRCTYYLGDVLFDDDPRLTPALRERERGAPGGSGIVQPLRDADGWRAQRDVVLGLGVPDYRQCAPP